MFVPYPETPIIVGLTGTHGAGKGETVKFFESLRFKHFSAREHVLWPEVDLRGMPRNRDSLNHVANDLRKLHGPEFVAFQLFECARLVNQNTVIESVYTIGEINRIRAAAREQFFLLAIDADLEIRYNRIHGRDSETDRISIEEFRKQQDREMQNADPSKHNLAACQRAADTSVIMNNGTVAELHEKLRDVCIRCLGFPALL